ncbi:sigma-54-dependent transcriptional regulator [Enterococcus columbae]|uniref:Transcriptional antiterminator bglG:Sigma-54 factor n=1 Tax=Enterococcus columbae DSM 7374 = ATCC 51263 TaxID=1121865 RepID=S1NI26_9ENTE|nr:sigma-54-dependent transcriptional regulator [Enterococcus columbae]EOT40413.1 hypothetical protein OMW_01527 [Enterococcus columbae DSM 7374 = ATCC 51263]EOW80439.1 hypothetical protein I568_02142 [Enterococcus columbae DSM 7374 = ATCC 51263]OJG23729.1 hypothetical protein RR47_GL000444 [Enterococcus columbae DSM 7374 = ATCC 51263]
MKRMERIYQWLIDYWNVRNKEEIFSLQGSSAKEIADDLGLSRANVSADLNELVRNRELLKIKSYPVKYLPIASLEKNLGRKLLLEAYTVNQLSEIANELSGKATNQSRNPFENIIGANESLKKAITQAKAAIYYPPNGLHMLLLGPTGSGKTFFANKIYQYAIYEELLAEDAPFKSFNCADYYHNPQLLLSQLFGYKKGAFTGADEDYPGLVEQANGGILLLDEIHRLTPEGQEMLFYLIDHGKFNRLGENGFARQAKVLIICATTEDPNSSLLDTFLRRIPMTIEIPALQQRSLKERVELTKFLFHIEAKRIQRKFSIDMDVIQALVQTVSYGNVGQLKTQVQLICAQAFLNYLHQESEMKITMKELPEEIRTQWLAMRRTQKTPQELLNYLEVTTVISPEYESPQPEVSETRDFNIYELIEDKVEILEKEGISEEEIYQYILTDLHLHIRSVVNQQTINYQLLKFIDPKISQLTLDLKNLVEKSLNYSFDRRFVYYVGMHLDSFVKRGKKVREILDVDIHQMKNEHHAEYQAALECRRYIEDYLQIHFPEMEVIYLTMLLVSLETLNQKDKVGILVVAHGNQTATSMVQVGVELLGSAPILALDMPLTVSPEEMFEKMVHHIKELDFGKGVLLLVDMGSLALMEQRLSEASNVKIRTISNVTTSMVLDVIRKVNYMDLDLSAIYHSVKKDFIDSLRLQNTYASGTKPKAILVICTTGKGTAIKLERMLLDLVQQLTEETIEIIPVSALKIAQEVEKLKTSYQIIASVGTKNPQINAPFIELTSLVDGKGENVIRQILGGKKKATLKNSTPMVVKDLCKDTFSMYLVYLNPVHITDLLLEWTKDLQLQMNQRFSNTRLIRIIIHTGFAFERVIKKNPLTYDDVADTETTKVMTVVKQTIQKIEAKLDLFLSEDEKLYIAEAIIQE